MPPPASAPRPDPARATSAAPAPARPGRPPAPRHLRAVPSPTHTGRAGRGVAVPRPEPSPDRGATWFRADIPPPPEILVQRLAVYAFEVLEGSRAVTQLAGWITPEVAEGLRARRALRAEREALTRDRRRRVASPGRAHVCRPLPHVVEATVVLHTESRSNVVALRLEHRRERWRATDITVL